MVEKELCFRGVFRWTESVNVWELLPLGQLYRLAIVVDFCITLLWGGLKLVNLVWLKNCGRWFVL